MSDLLNNIPETEPVFNSSKNSLLKQIQSQRITKANILFNYEQSKKLGWDHDIRKDIYEQIKNYNISDVLDFQKKYVKDKHYVILVLGDVKKLDMNTLEKYGQVKVLTLKDVFGY